MAVEFADFHDRKSLKHVAKVWSVKNRRLIADGLPCEGIDYYKKVLVQHRAQALGGCLNTPSGSTRVSFTL